MMEIKLFAYRHGSSVIHKIPPLIKIIFLIIFCIVTFSGSSYRKVEEILSISVIIRTTITFTLSLTCFFLSDAKWKTLKSLSFIWLLGAMVTIFKMLYFASTENVPSHVIMIYKNFGLDINGFASGVLYTIRFFTTTLTAQIIFETTSVIQIKNSIESIQNYFAKIVPQIKNWNLAFAITLAITFIPMVFEMWNKVHLASRARSGSSKKNIIKIVAITFKELEALLSCLLHKAERKRQAVLNRSNISL